MHRLTILALLATFLLSCANSMARDESPYTISELSMLPHQAGTCDLIFTGVVIDGTIVSNNEECAAEFAVDDVLWGHVNSSTITVRSISWKDLYDLHPFGYVSGERYLVCAFTNNWWASQSWNDTYRERLYGYLSVTSTPPGNAVFHGYRTMCPRYTAIPFSKINYKGSNYWPATRALVTNLVEMARIRGDRQAVRDKLTAIIEMGQVNSGLSPRIWNDLWRYRCMHASWLDWSPPPPQSPGNAHAP